MDPALSADYFENWLVLVDSSALAESLVSLPTAKQEPSGEPEGTRASDKTLRRRRQQISWRLTDDHRRICS